MNLSEFDFYLSKENYESLLGQSGKVLWFYGLSGSGKSTLANELSKNLFKKGKFVIVLDGDSMRKTISKDLGFSDEDRRQNLLRMAELAKFLASKGVIVLASFITPLKNIRDEISQVMRGVDFEFILVDADISVCQERDPKGLYKKKIKNFTGIDSPFEKDVDHLSIDTTYQIGDCLSKLENHLGLEG